MSDKHSKAMKAAQAKRRELKESGVEIKQRNPLERLQDNPKSFPLIIRALCFRCMGGMIDYSPHNWRTDVKNCTDPICPAWIRRPFQTGVEQGEDEFADQVQEVETDD